MHTSLNFTTALLLCSALIMSCNKSTQLTRSKSGDSKEVAAKHENNARRAFELGIISYEPQDSSEYNQQKVDMIADMMKSALESILLIDNEIFVVMRTDEEHDAKLREVYNAGDNILTSILELRGEQYYTQQNLEEEPLTEISEEEKEEFKEMIDIEQSESGKYVFFGFDCKKVTITSQEEYGIATITLFTADALPYFGNSFTRIPDITDGGMPVHYEFQLYGLSVVGGIIKEVSPDDFENDYNVDLTGYTQLDYLDFVWKTPSYFQ